jgi:hypothetical protein
LHEKAKVNRLLFLLFNKLLPLKTTKSSKGPNSTSPLEDKLHLNPIFISIFYGLIFIVIKGIIDDPIYCDNDDDENSTTTSNSKSKLTAENTSNNTNNTQPESFNSRLGKDTTAVTTELGKAVTDAAGKAIEKAGLACAIAAGMGAGATISAGQPLKVRAATSSALGVVGGITHLFMSAANRSLAAYQGSRKTGSDSTPPSPGIEPTDYPFNSVNEPLNSINLEPILDNPVKD